MAIIMYSYILLLFTTVRGQQNACTKFQEIPENDYERTYTTINDASSTNRPLGFLKSTVVYQGSQTHPCFSLSGGKNGQYLEIKFETVPSMLLCVHEKETGETFCDDGRHSSCRAFTKDTMSYEFFCDKSQGCAEADVNFWFRLTKGPNPRDESEGMWCSNLENDYPEGLRSLPGNFSPPPKYMAAGSATSQCINDVIVVLTTTFVLQILEI